MTNSFDLPSLFMGIYLTVPLVLGCYLLFGFNHNLSELTKAQRVAGILLLLDAIYLIVRTVNIAQVGFNNPVLRLYFYILDSTMLTIFAVIPYTVITERYPKWWMCLLAFTPALLIPVIHFTHINQMAMWSHVFPVSVAITVLILSIKYAHKADESLTDFYANPEGHEKSWIVWVCVGFIVVTVASFVRYLYPVLTWYNLLVNCMWSALIIAVFWMLTRQNHLGGGVGIHFLRKK